MSQLFDGLSRAGFSYSEAQALRRIEMTLHRWAEHECNGEIERDETTGKAYAVSMAYVNGTGDYNRWPTADRETGALARLAKIMAKHPKFVAYNQSDPRGCALYIVRKSDIPKDGKLESYYTRGIAVCV